MKEVLTIGNYRIETDGEPGWRWHVRVLNAHREIETEGDTREEALDEAMDIIRATRPIEGPLGHRRWARPKTLKPSNNEIARGVGFNRR